MPMHETRNQPQENKLEKKITWTLNNFLLKSKWIKKGITKEILQYLETNDNENITI